MTTAQRILLTTAALLGLTSVMAGAAIDHLGLSGDHALATAERYHQLYAVVVLTIGFSGERFRPRGMTVAAGLFLFGTLCFCGGIYGAAASGMHGLLYLAPVGGTALMAAWVVLAIVILHRNTAERP